MGWVRLGPGPLSTFMPMTGRDDAGWDYNVAGTVRGFRMDAAGMGTWGGDEVNICDAYVGLILISVLFSTPGPFVC